MISAVAITGMVNVVYNFEIPSEGIAKHVVPPMIEASDMLADSLAGSTIVPKLIVLMETIPTIDLDFVQLDFSAAAHNLNQRVD